MSRQTSNLRRNNLLSIPAGSVIIVVREETDPLSIEGHSKTAEEEMKFEFYDSIDFGVREIWLRYDQVDGAIERWILKREDVTEHQDQYPLIEDDDGI